MQNMTAGQAPGPLSYEARPLFTVPIGRRSPVPEVITGRRPQSRTVDRPTAPQQPTPTPPPQPTTTATSTVTFSEMVRASTPPGGLEGPADVGARHLGVSSAPPTPSIDRNGNPKLAPVAAVGGKLNEEGAGAVGVGSESWLKLWEEDTTFSRFDMERTSSLTSVPSPHLATLATHLPKTHPLPLPLSTAHMPFANPPAATFPRRSSFVAMTPQPLPQSLLSAAAAQDRRRRTQSTPTPSFDAAFLPTSFIPSPPRPVVPTTTTTTALTPPLKPQRIDPDTLPTTILPPRLASGGQSRRASASGVPGASGDGAGGATQPPLPPFKTVLCRTFVATGRCFRERPETCWFAHGVGELRESLSPAFLGGAAAANSSGAGTGGSGARATGGGGGRTWGGVTPVAAPTAATGGGGGGEGRKLTDARVYKTEICRFFEWTGTCRFGDLCTFAHGADDLRARAY
ncbi:hypothetical protein HK101_009736 [Irineochytrium annulatum]|nr:hypothetical protein HK101_009736 [Irineochytrium annulatum]